MPGVPHGRACEACRKLKKKCDEKQPTCSRCQRLGIPCVGSGAKRYRWSIETTNRTRGRGPSDTKTEIVLTTSSTPSSNGSPSPSISPIPSNTQTLLALTLIDKVHLDTRSDIRYNLTWAYGPFIQEVPRRLGQNAALDAAATSLALSHVRYATGRRDIAPEELKAYVNALSVLRNSLDDHTVARDPNTLCAVMLLLLSQQFIGGSSSFTGHGEGALIILKSKGIYHDPVDEFEGMMLQSLRGPLLFEALFNPRLQLSDEEWIYLITRHEPKSAPTDVLQMIASWSHFPKLTAAAREAWKCKSKVFADGFKDVLKTSRELYSTSILLLDRLRSAYINSAAEIDRAQDEASILKARYMYAFHQRVYSMSVFTACYFNCLIRAMSPPEKRAQLCAEAIGYTKEILTLAYQAMQFRPMGSSFVPMCLMVAWCTPVDDSMRIKIADLWDQYRSDFVATRCLKVSDAVEECGFLQST